MRKIIFVFALSVLSNITLAKTIKKSPNLTTQTVQNIQSATVSSQAPANAGNVFNHEVFTSLTSGQLLIGKECSNCSSTTTINLAGAYFHFIQDKIQAGVEAGIKTVSSGKTNTYFDFAAVGVYNFDSNFINSFYAKAGLGLYTIPSGTTTESKIGLFVGGGKRFALLPNLNFAPEVRLMKKGDLDVAIEATIVNFSIHWN